MAHDNQRPTATADGSHAGAPPPLALEQLAQGIERVEAVLITLEQLVDAHCSGAQLTTREAAKAAVHAFTTVWQTVSAQALKYTAQMTASDRIFTATRPTMCQTSATRRISDIVGALLLEHSGGAQTTLEYLKGAAARAQTAAARLAAADRTDRVDQAAKAAKE